jgi:hypothetical protein
MSDNDAFDPAADLDPTVPPHCRDAMLDLVLAWAAVDGALSMWFGQVFGLTPSVASILVSRADGGTKLQRMMKVRLAEGKLDEVKKIKSIKKSYEDHVKPRNIVAHSKCVGVRKSDPDYVVFMTFETFGVDSLAVDHVPVQQMQRSTKFARELEGVAMTYAIKSGHYT